MNILLLKGLFCRKADFKKDKSVNTNTNDEDIPFLLTIPFLK